MRRNRGRPTLSTALATDRAATRWLVPVRIALVLMIALSVAVYLGDENDVVPLGFGIVFAALGDPRGVFTFRLRGIVLATLGMTAATEFGMLVSERSIVHPVVLAVVAFICGYVGIAGPRAALAGMLALAMFAIYSGAPVPVEDSFRTTALVFLGGMIAVVVILLPLVLLRMGGVRTDVAIAYRSLALALRDDPTWHRSETPFAKLRAARDRVGETRAYDETGRWYGDLLAALVQVRLVTFGLQSERTGASAAAIARLDDDLAHVLLAIAAAIELEPRRRRVPRAVERARAGIAQARTDLPADMHAALDEVRAALDTAAAAVSADFPLGRRCSVSPEWVVRGEPIFRLWRRPDADRLYVRHGLRLAACMVIATAITYVVDLPHDYWLPMTVAWIMKPDYASTVPRLVSRVTGVVVGSLIMAGIVLTLGNGIIVGIICASVAALLFLVFVAPNYALATVGITSVVVALLLIDDKPLSTTLGPQIICAVSAGVICTLAMRIWPTRTTRLIAAELAAFASALGAYLVALHGPARRDGDERLQLRDSVFAARVRATATVIAAQLERPPHRVHANGAKRVLDDLNDALAIGVAVDLQLAEADRAGVDATSGARCRDLADRLTVAHDTGVIPPASTTPTEGTARLPRLLNAAHVTVDEAATHLRSTTGIVST
jgi:uncharacterized membrane protein YccC